MTWQYYATGGCANCRSHFLCHILLASSLLFYKLAGALRLSGMGELWVDSCFPFVGTRHQTRECWRRLIESAAAYCYYELPIRAAFATFAAATGLIIAGMEFLENTYLS